MCLCAPPCLCICAEHRFVERMNPGWPTSSSDGKREPIIHRGGMEGRTECKRAEDVDKATIRPELEIGSSTQTFPKITG